MVGEMVQNSQSLYSFTFNVVIIIHEYVYSHSTTKFIFKKYINSHLTTYFVFTNIFTHIYGMYSFTFIGYIHSHSRSKYWFNTVQYSFNIFCAPPSRIIRSQLPLYSERRPIIWRGRTKTKDPKHTQLNINITWTRWDNRLLDDFGWASR